MSDKEVIHLSGSKAPQQQETRPADLKGPKRFKKETKFEFAKVIIPISAIATGGLTMLAAPSLLDASGILGITKIMLLGSAAGFVSYVVNDSALKYGPELYAKGLKLAAVSSALPVLFVGISATAFSFTGLTIDRVNELNLQEHGQKLSSYSESVNSYASQINQLSPVIDAVTIDIQRNLQCEVSAGCLSKGKGGKGRTYRALLPLVSQASGIAEQVNAGKEFRGNQLTIINKLSTEYQESLSKSDLSFDERQRVAARISARIKQEISPLRESLPSALLRGYGNTLNAGITINKEPEASKNVNAMLARHGNTIASALDGVKPDKSSSPEFPAKAGVSQAFNRFGHFWPIGVLTASIELLIPITLWLFAYLIAFWKVYEDEHTPGDEDES